MSSTVPDGVPFVNLLPGPLGRPGPDLYDWREIVVTRLGRIRRRMELTPPVARYEQVARQLRKRIFDGEFPPGTPLPSGPELSREHGVSQHAAQRALEQLEAEGLVRMESGRRTMVMPRFRYRAEAAVQWAAPGAVPARAAKAALARYADPAVSGTEVRVRADMTPALLMAAMTVEAADPAQAVARCWAAVREALGTAGDWDLAGACIEAQPEQDPGDPGS